MQPMSPLPTVNTDRNALEKLGQVRNWAHWTVGTKIPLPERSKPRVRESAWRHVMNLAKHTTCDLQKKKLKHSTEALPGYVPLACCQLRPQPLARGPTPRVGRGEGSGDSKASQSFGHSQGNRGQTKLFLSVWAWGLLLRALHAFNSKNKECPVPRTKVGPFPPGKQWPCRSRCSRTRSLGSNHSVKTAVLRTRQVDQTSLAWTHNSLLPSFSPCEAHQGCGVCVCDGQGGSSNWL